MAGSAHGQARVLDVDGIGVRVSSPDRPVFPGVTKADVVDYYLAVGARMLEAVAGRPSALERWPDGVHEGAEHFYSKHLPRGAPAYVSGIGIEFPSGRTGTLLDPGSRAAIAWAVQMGTITFHAWPVTVPNVTNPDQLRLDLDPEPGTMFADVVSVAVTCHEVMDEWGWPAFVKTSGGRGLHVFVPIAPAWSFVDVRHAAIAIGREVQRRRPDLVTMSWWKEGRDAPVFIDFNQNAQDRVMASAYSLRPRPEATVSMPVSWSSLPGLEPLDFTVQTVPALVASEPDSWAGMREAAVALDPALTAWARNVADGLPELPYPPDFPKMPGEPPRVQPSRKRKEPGAID